MSELDKAVIAFKQQVPSVAKQNEIDKKWKDMSKTSTQSRLMAQKLNNGGGSNVRNF